MTTLLEIAQRLQAAQHVVVLTGSGISAESGIPTFRDAQTGLWARFQPEQLATQDAFDRNPKLVWEWYAWRRSLVAQAEPNAGHRALAEMQAKVRRITLVTQNVDGLHQRAGSRDVIEYHGNITRNLCSKEGTELMTLSPQPSVPPLCPNCGAWVRPGVVWFGEAIPENALVRADEAARHCDVFLSIGTSSLVYPAAGLAEATLRAGAFVVEINPSITPLTRLADAAFSGKAGEVLPQIVGALHTLTVDR
jgi:NAD-dependent deacetylase